MTEYETKISFLNDVLKMMGVSQSVTESNYEDFIHKDIDDFVAVDSMSIMRLASFINEKLGYRVNGDAGDLDTISSIKGFSELYEQQSAS